MTELEAATGSDIENLAASEIHDVLRNDRRRLVLERLRAGGGTETVADLAERIGAIESGESPPPRNIRQSAYVSLHQTHLPKLDELEIVEYDPDAKTVTLAENAEDVAVYMEVGPQYSLSWAEYYLGLGVLGALSSFAASLGVPVLRSLSPGVIGAGLSLVLVASALYQLYTQEGSLLHRFRDE
jgi:hypothetical protein